MTKYGFLFKDYLLRSKNVSLSGGKGLVVRVFPPDPLMCCTRKSRHGGVEKD